MFKRVTYTAALAALLLAAYGNVQAQAIKVTIDTKHPMQTIEGFGASDAWACQFAGTWPDAKRNRMADLLFSNATGKNGQPLGIGLNTWRFSIGAGSAQQGAGSDIGDDWRRQLSFLDTAGKYNWDAMPGQTWFLNAAKQRGVTQFLGFVNSPHVRFTLNGKAYSSDGKCNLDFNKLQNFTSDITATINGIKNKTGITLNYISPVNEPQWKWNEHNQEGCPYTNRQIADVVKSLSAGLSAAKLSTKIQIADAGQLNYLYSDEDKEKGNQVNAFFNSASPLYVGNLPNVDNSISGHSYFTTSPEAKGVEIRGAVAAEVAKVKGLRYWMSEYCVLGDATLKGEGRDLGMETALFIAKLIHHDLSISNATSWQWWMAVSPGDYKDGLVYIDKNKTDGNVYDSKMLWAMGNYSRFVKPGSKRLPVTAANLPNGVYLSAYAYKNQTITVAVNTGQTDVTLNIGGKQGKVQTHITSAKYNLYPAASYNSAQNINVPAQSVTTIVCQ